MGPGVAVFLLLCLLGALLWWYATRKDPEPYGIGIDGAARQAPQKKPERVFQNRDYFFTYTEMMF